MTALLFSDRNVNSNLITWNRVVLLHGKACGVAFCKIDYVMSGFTHTFVLLQGVTAVLFWRSQSCPKVFLLCKADAAHITPNICYVTLHLAATQLLPCDFLYYY